MTLTELVRSRLAELGLSARAAAARTHGGISHATIATFTNGQHSGRITDKTAAGLAVALDLPISRIYEAAATPQPLSRWDWPARFDRIPTPQRRLVEDFAAALLEAYERGKREAGGEQSSPGRPHLTSV